MERKDLNTLTYWELQDEERHLFATYTRHRDPIEKAEHLEYMAQVIRQQVTGRTKTVPPGDQQQ